MASRPVREARLSPHPRAAPRARGDGGGRGCWLVPVLRLEMGHEGDMCKKIPRTTTARAGQRARGAAGCQPAWGERGRAVGGRPPG